MAVTRAQVNAGKAQIFDRCFARYAKDHPELVRPLVRIAVQAIKQGNATEREVGKAILREAYTAMNRDPVGYHPFRHWLYDMLQGADDKTIGVSEADAVDAEAITVT